MKSVFIDRLDAGMATDDAGQPCSVEASWQYSCLRNVLTSFGFEKSYALLHDEGRQCLGLSRDQLAERLRNSAMLLNAMGYLNDESLLTLAPKRVFLDIDPGFGQMWRALGWADIFSSHTAFLTVGLNLGQGDCAVPDCGIQWITTRPPVVLEHWPVSPPPADCDFTSVVSWRGAFAPIDYLGKTYGLRCHEFRRFAQLPRTTGQHFRLALDIHADESRDLDLLHSAGWTLDNPALVAYDPGSYQNYIRESGAELMIAKNMYVQARTGWFSDRTACYLASGRPAVAQDTGLPAELRDGQGLLLFETPEEAADAVRSVAADYQTHSRAARRLAEEQFDSDLVLRQLLQKLSIV